MEQLLKNGWKQDGKYWTNVAQGMVRLTTKQATDFELRAAHTRANPVQYNEAGELANPPQEVFDMVAEAIGHRASNDPACGFHVQVNKYAHEGSAFSRTDSSWATLAEAKAEADHQWGLKIHRFVYVTDGKSTLYNPALTRKRVAATV